MKLEENYKHLHKSYTVIITFVAILISMIEVILPTMGLLQPVLTQAQYGITMFVLTVMTAVGRYIKQDLSDGKFDGKIGEDINDKTNSD